LELSTVTAQDCAGAVAADMVAADVWDAVLVGHSLAGVTVPRVLPLASERLRAAVLVSAIVPAHGEPVMTVMAPATRAAVDTALASGIYSPGSGVGLEMLCNDLDTEPTDLSGLAAPVPRWYVHLTLDHRVPPTLQDACYGHWGGERATLNTGHMAMLSDPRGLAEVLEAIRHRNAR
jgi:hypothetical protein